MENENEIVEFVPNLDTRYTEMEVLQMLNKFADYLLEVKNKTTDLSLVGWFELNRKK